MKTAATLDKVVRLLTRGRHPGLPGTLALRTGRLLRQFQDLAIGLRHLPPARAIDVDEVLCAVVDVYRATPAQDDPLSFADDPERFSGWLIVRIGRHSRLSAIAFD